MSLPPAHRLLMRADTDVSRPSKKKKKLPPGASVWKRSTTEITATIGVTAASATTRVGVGEVGVTDEEAEVSSMDRGLRDGEREQQALLDGPALLRLGQAGGG